MLDGKTVAVVVPAFDEEHLIGTTIAGIPELVDRVIVVDDASRDETAGRARASGDPRVEVITHEKNQGVGAAILTGYRRALERRIDVTASWPATTRWTRTTWRRSPARSRAARPTTRRRTASSPAAPGS